MKVRIEYEHDVCVGTNACMAADPQHFELLEDGKAHIIGSAQARPEKWSWESDMDENALKTILAAAEACPVNAIHVFVDGVKKI
ncbi:MAG: ferredoxin [Candidatus Aenigmatarchaeota archaeon]|nr:MAG: ferredoxin [Candidatus Aenigmarchaeota archaeon]